MKKIAFCFLMGCFATFSAAQVVRTDSLFGVNGKVATKMFDSYGNPYGNNLVLLPNGKVATIGIALDSTYLPAVEKFSNNGALDSNFTQFFPNLSDNNLGLSVQLDGKLLVTGREPSSPFNGSLSRMLPDAGMDTNFGVDGSSSLAVDAFDNIIPMELSSGKIVVFGDEAIPNQDISVFVTRLHSNGTIDTTFGESGYFRFGLPDKYLLISAGVEQPDGKLLFAGMAHWKLFLIRLLPDGTIDLSFGTDGYVIDPMPNGGEAYALALQPDGKMVVCGYGVPSYQPIVARYNSNGSRDTTFGDQGVVYFTEVGEYTEGIGIQVLPSGKILAGISSFEGINFYLAKLLPNGARDTTIGTNGIYEYTDNNFRARAISRNGNMLAVSGREESSSSSNRILLLRFLLDLQVGTLNPTNPSAPGMLIYPNPIADQFTFQFGLSQKAQVSLRLYDMAGKPVQTFVQGQAFEPGEHALSLACADQLVAGNYVLTLEAGGKKLQSIQIIKN